MIPGGLAVSELLEFLTPLAVLKLCGPVELRYPKVTFGEKSFSRSLCRVINILAKYEHREKRVKCIKICQFEA
jgi:hypothetical protein